MKYKLLRLSLLSMLVMFFGGLAYAQDETIDFSALGYDNAEEVTTVQGTDVTLSFDKGTNSYTPKYYTAGTAVRLYGGNTLKVSSSTKTIEKVVFTFISSSYNLNSPTVDKGSYDSETSTWTGSASEFTITRGGTSGHARIQKMEFYYAAGGQTDIRQATTLTLGEYQTTGVVGESMNLPTVTVATAESTPVENVDIEWTSSDETVAGIADGIINFNAAGTTTIKASFAGDNSYKGSSASFTLTVTAAPYTSIAAMLADITSTKTTVTYQFENLLVTYVNGSNTYVSDGRNGFLLYGSNLGLNTGETITGTITGQLYTYNGLPEMAVSANGISAQVVSEGNLVAWPTIPAADLQSYINIPVTIENAVYVEAGSGKNLTFKVGDETLAVYNNWSIDVAALEADKAYTLTGVGSVYAKGETTTYQLYLVSFEEKAEEPAGWRDIKADLTSTSLLPEGASQWDDVSTGIAVAEDGTLSRVDKEGAVAVLNGKWHGTQYGWANFSATVSVEGTVKISVGQNNYGKDMIVKDASGETVAKINNMGNDLWSPNNSDRVAVGYYRVNEPTTLTFEYGSYLGYFAVEAIDPADLPEEVIEYTVSFAKGDAEGIAPADIKVEEGQPAFMPANTTLYIEGKTLTGWEYEGQVYAAGEEITVTNDTQLTPVFTDNTVAFNDRTEEVTVNWDATQKTGGAPQLGFERNTGFIVGQATVNGETIDMKLNIDATAGKFNNSNGEWIQVNNGTKFILPACKGASYSIYTMGDSGENTFNGEKGAYANNYNTYTYDGTEETMEIVVGGGSWYKAITATYPVVEQQEEPGELVFRDFQMDLRDANGGILTADEASNSQTVNFGITVDENNTVTRVEADAENTAAVITGKTGNNHGLQNFSATVPVEGPVQITMSTCSWGGDVTVKNAEGETMATFTTKKGEGGTGCYQGNGLKDENIVSAKYVGEATTLTIEGGAYVGFFAVQAVEASSVTIAYSLGDVECKGDILPTGGTYAKGDEYTIPAQNFTLYKEGYTLTGWTDGENTYATGETITLAGDLNLTPVFTENKVNLSDRTEAVTLNFSFRRDQGAPIVQWQNTNGHVWVTQAEINGTTIDVPMTIDTNPGKFNNSNNTDCAQTNNGTVFTVPSCKGAEVTLECHGSFSISTTTIDGQTDYEGSGTTTIKQTIASSAETVQIVIGDGSYYRYVKVVLPVVESQGGGETFVNEVATIEWPMDEPADYSKSTATPDGAFSTVAVDLGAVRLMDQNGNENATGTSNVSSGVTFSQMRPTNDGSDFVTWVVKPAAGLTFTPTKVTAYIVRFGTDSKSGVTFSAKAGEGETVKLGTFTAPRNNKSKADDKYGSESDYAENGYVEIELTEAQQTALASGEGFSLMGTVGVGNSKAGGIAQVTVSGLVNGTKADVAMYTLTTAVAPEEAGSINVYPVSEQYEAGSDVKLTANENFGYDFVNWTDAEGTVVSEEPVFTYTMNSDATLTANFVAVETYELVLTVDGTNDYMVAVSPAPTVVDGKNMYEAGTAVQLTANQYEGLVTFNNWSDGDTNSGKLISMTENIEITAMYAQADIIAGWDFYTAGGNGRKADFYAQDNDADALNLVDTETGDVSGWLDKSTLGAGGYESFKGAAVNWRGTVGSHHWQTKINAEAFESINVQFQMLYNYNAYQTYNAEYSLDGENWIKFGSITMSGAKQVASFNEALPAEANNKSELYIRMLADKTSNIDGANGNDGNTLAMFFITGTPKLVDDGAAPVLVSTVPANGATGVSASGKIVLTFDERVKTADTFMPTATLGSLTLTPTVSGKTVTFEYKGLEYSTEYTFNLPAGSIADLTNNFVQEAITLTFTTMERPTVTKGLYDYVVENVEDLMAAIAAAQARSDKNVRYRVFIKNGEYTIPLSQTMKTCNGYEVPECITFINTDNVSFIGESRDGVIITNGIDPSETFAGTYGTTSKYDGIGNSDVFQLRGQGYYWQDLTVETGMNDATGRDLAIHDRGTQNIYKNVGLRGYQDTWTSNNDNGLYYFEGGYVRGRTDYMCGKGDIFWNGVELRQIAGGYAAVPSKPAKYGWIYKDCVINGEGSGVDGNYTLGRPWGSGTPIALFIDTKMNVVPSAIGWNEMSGGWPARFAEYNSMTSTGSVIDLSGRKKTFGDGHENNPVLTAEEALENSDLHRMFGDWDPTLATEQAPVPTEVTLNTDTKELTWANSDYALLWAIVKDGKVIDFTVEPKYTVDDTTAAYNVRAANEMGGLSETSATAAITTAISEVANGEQAVPETIYNLNGVRVEKAQKGLYIINGRKVVVK